MSPPYNNGSSTEEHERDTITRQIQTVLPFLANTKKYTVQTTYTSLVDKAIDNMTDDKVLKIDPQLSRRKRVTLSQLHSGHWHFWIPTKSDWGRLTLHVI